jgi:UV DNA damage endonuclease
MLNFGYACINTELKAKKVYSSRTARIATIQKNPDILHEISLKNLKDLQTILCWNVKHQIKLFRISSSLFPFMSHPVYGYKLDKYQNELKKIGDYAKEHNLRLTMHVGQWTLLTSKKESVTDNALVDLERHCDILDYLGCDQNSVIVIHGGVKESQELFKKNFLRLPERVQKRIALENCELAYKVEDLLPLCEELNIPLILDYHHFNLNNKIPIEKLMDRILSTWSTRNIKPKFHQSESRDDAKSGNITSLRKHNDIIKNLPRPLPDVDIDLMLEAKLKEQSIFYLRKNYDHLAYQFV